MIIFPLGASKDLKSLCHILAMTVVSASGRSSIITQEEKQTLSLEFLSLPAAQYFSCYPSFR